MTRSDIPVVAEIWGDQLPYIVAAYRPLGNGFGRKTGWMKAMEAGRVFVSRASLRRLKEQGYTRVRLGIADHVDPQSLSIELLLS